MSRIYAQGDILLERVGDVPSGRQVEQCLAGGSLVIAEGEATGHSHRIVGQVAMYRDDALARAVPRGLYVGHLRVGGATARLDHEEHAPIMLPQGTYRVRRQRAMEPTDTEFQDQYSHLAD
jgi:hypothetical protein